jgi:putative ABC transport system substrate-binding protein
MRRRDFITLLGSAAAAWPLVARAQQAALPVIGMSYGSPTSTAADLTVFREGLSEVGYTEGRNVVIENSWAYGQYDRFPELAAALFMQRLLEQAAVSSASGHRIKL